MLIDLHGLIQRNLQRCGSNLGYYIHKYIRTLIHFIDPTFANRRMNMKHVRYYRLLNAAWSKKRNK